MNSADQILSEKLVRVIRHFFALHGSDTMAEDLAAGDQQPTIVVFNIFSGKPNPTWSISQQKAELFKKFVSELEESDEKMPEPTGLGYNGFTVKCGKDIIEVKKRYVRKDGHVLVAGNMWLEMFLLSTAPKEVIDEKLRNSFNTVFVLSGQFS